MRSLDDVLNRVDASTLLLLLDGVTDPRNLGACLRVADAAGVNAVIVPRDRSAGLTPSAMKAAAGAAETVPLIAVINLARAMDDLREADVRMVGAAGEAAQSLFELDLTGPLAWALGAEEAGLRRLTRERCDVLARIPLAGHVESLNVSVATGICLFESKRQRGRPAPGLDRSRAVKQHKLMPVISAFGSILFLGAFALLPLHWVSIGAPWVPLLVTFIAIPLIDRWVGPPRGHSDGASVHSFDTSLVCS